MSGLEIAAVSLHAEVKKWPLKAPFRITGYVWEYMEVLDIRLEKRGVTGRGEAVGVYYKNDTAPFMLKQIQELRSTIETRVSRQLIQDLLPPGGARNALDCAVWDLEAKLTGVPVWQLAGLKAPKPLLTTFTCGADSPEAMAATARGYENAKAIKIKLTGEHLDSERVRAIRDARPDVWLGVDANQGFSRAFLETLMPTLLETGVKLIEQPFPIGQDALLDDFKSAIPVAADESVQSLVDIPLAVGRFDVINIKLDKCGGLSEGLAMARAARNLGLEVMVGNMTGTSLAMAPAFLVGQFCNVVDLDGPIFLKDDRPHAVQYSDGFIRCTQSVWG